MKVVFRFLTLQVVMEIISSQFLIGKSCGLEMLNNFTKSIHPVVLDTGKM